MNTVVMDVGVPRQQLNLLLDINAYMPFLYQSNCYQYHNSSYNCSVWPFNVNQTYDYSKSITFTNFTANKNNTKFYYNAGFRLDAALAVDHFCAAGTQFCYSSTFANVKDLRQNYFFKYVPLPEVNGVLGAGYWPQYANYNSLWYALAIE